MKVYIQLILAHVFLIQIFLEPVYGCTDSTAINFNSSANIDDGSCIPSVFGCTDSTALNFNVLANVDDGTCIAVIIGCTDSTAANFNPFANVSDSSECHSCFDNYVNMQINTSNFGSDIAWELIDSNGVVIANGGCQTFPGNCYSSNTTYDNWLCIPNGCYSIAFIYAW